MDNTESQTWTYHPVVRRSELPQGSGAAFVVAGIEVALFDLGEQVYAIENCCAHQGAPLHDGDLIGSVVHCALHGWPFDVRTGQAPLGHFPCVQSFPVRIESGMLWVGLPELRGDAP